ncbi:hypothetical protein C8R43DRAFT_1130942 [Mycena crocata]|nr:hypothetical protein C8R43DRAFT_1130942 [Mycena crocata]
MPTIVDRLPPELRFVVLSLYFGFADEDFTLRAFYKQRAVLCASCVSLAAVVHAEPFFWRRILVTPRTPSEFISSSLSRASKLHLEFIFRFMGIQSSSSECCAHLVAKLAFVKSAILHATHVHIATDCPSAFRSFHTLFSYASAPLLRKLTLNFQGCVADSTSLHPPPRILDACVWFQGTWRWSERRCVLVRSEAPALDRLEALTLTAAVVPLPHNGFRSLQSLNIAHIPHSSSISAASLRSVIAHSPRLTSLGLFAASCSDVLSASPVPVTLAPSLTDLHVAWSLDHSISAFLCTLSLPRLDYVQMLITSSECIADALRCSVIFYTVQALCLYDYDDCTFPIHPLFSAFPLLERLDLSAASPSVFNELSQLSTFDIRLDRTFCLPHLTTLSLPLVDLFALKSFLQNRFLGNNLGSPITEVTMTAPALPAFDYRVYDYLSWLDFRLAEFILT